jgi:hypothetical protein
VDHLEDLWAREAWPELCNDFEAVTLANGQFTKNDATKGDVLSVYIGGNPQTTTICDRVTNWVEGDGVVRLTTDLTGTVYVEYQDIVPTLPDYGEATLAAFALPARFKLPLACLAAADLVEDEDPAKAGRLRQRAESELLRQTSRWKSPWWRM